MDAHKMTQHLDFMSHNRQHRLISLMIVFLFFCFFIFQRFKFNHWCKIDGTHFDMLPW